MKIIIIGGGIGGLTAAIALDRVGIDAEVYEQAPALLEVGAGISVMPNAVLALDLLRLGNDVRAQSTARVQGGVRDWRGRELLAIPQVDLGTLAILHRAELLGLLGQHVHSGRLHLNRACVGFEQHNAGVTAHFRDGESAHADGLIAADGLRSVIREQLLGSRPIRYAGYTAWRSVVPFKSENLPITETWGRGRRFGIVPMSRYRVYWFATNNAPQGERDPAGKTKPLLAHLFEGWHEPIEKLIAASQEDTILRNDIYDMDPVPHFARGRAGLLGDAAHAMTPNLGQGACQAIEDAVVLAACLKKSEDVSSGLIEYEQRRMPRTGRIVRESRRFGAIAQLENSVLRWARDTALRATRKELALRQIKSLLEFQILTPSEEALFSGPELASLDDPC